MTKKFVVAMMMHETNTFSPLATPIAAFARKGALSGPLAIAEAEGTNTSLGGFIEVARKADAEFHGADGGKRSSFGPGDPGRLRTDDSGHRRGDQERLRCRSVGAARRDGHRTL